MSDGPIDGRLLTMTGTSPEPAEMITRSIRAGPPRRISRNERQLVDTPTVSAASFMTLIDGNKRMDQSSMRLKRCFLTGQISERLRQHEPVDRVLRRAGFEPYAQSLSHCRHPRTLDLASPPGQLKTSCPFITAVAEQVLLVRHARIGSAVQRGYQPHQPAGRSHEPHPLWSGRASSTSRLALRTLIVSPRPGRPPAAAKAVRGRPSSAAVPP
jgi:hypothetical protein